MKIEVGRAGVKRAGHAKPLTAEGAEMTSAEVAEGSLCCAHDGSMTRHVYLCRMKINDVTGQVVDAAIKVHSALGPGLLESAYRACLAHELRKRGLGVQTEVPVPVVYDTILLDVAYRIDLLVAGAVVVEVKAINKLLPVHQTQLLSHLRLSDRRAGLLINFHVGRLKDGIVRMVNHL
jgi:GxxExxY protein